MSQAQKYILYAKIILIGVIGIIISRIFLVNPYDSDSISDKEISVEQKSHVLEIEFHERPVRSTRIQIIDGDRLSNSQSTSHPLQKAIDFTMQSDLYNY